MTTQVDPSADVSPGALLGEGCRVWHLAQIREGAELGAGCVIGRGAYLGAGVRLGANCKVQNYALVYEPAHLDDGVFVGPAAVFTNDRLPRAITPDGELKGGADWHAVGVTCREGASVGARAVCVAPVTIGRWAMVAAGAVVVSDVPDFSLVAGNPARFVRWIARTGQPLAAAGDGEWLDTDTGRRYREADGVLVEKPVGDDQESR